MHGVQRLAPEPNMVDIIPHQRGRIPICAWIGNHISAINAELNACLQACHDCFHPWQQRSIQIFAVPLATAFGIDGICNLTTQPITILVDVGRVVPQHWLRLVVHEYAHAHVGSPGHHAEYFSVLSHLCLGVGLEFAGSALTEAQMRRFPPYLTNADPLSFWRGQTQPYPLNVTDYYSRLEK